MALIMSYILLFFSIFLPLSESDELSHYLAYTLRIVMDCEAGYDLTEPVIAFSPLMFMRAVAVLRRIQNAYNCIDFKVYPDFNATDKRSWKFCVLGVCSIMGFCRCPKYISGENCDTFDRKYWLIYCMLMCTEKPSLICLCDSYFYKKSVQTSIYWYDEGLESAYRPAPPDFKEDPPLPEHLKIVAEIMDDIQDYQINMEGYKGTDGIGDLGPFTGTLPPLGKATKEKYIPTTFSRLQFFTTKALTSKYFVTKKIPETTTKSISSTISYRSTLIPTTTKSPTIKTTSTESRRPHEKTIEHVTTSRYKNKTEHGPSEISKLNKQCPPYCTAIPGPKGQTETELLFTTKRNYIYTIGKTWPSGKLVKHNCLKSINRNDFEKEEFDIETNEIPQEMKYENKFVYNTSDTDQIDAGSAEEYSENDGYEYGDKYAQIKSDRNKNDIRYRKERNEFHYFNIKNSSSPSNHIWYYNFITLFILYFCVIHL
ncbi:uncharacterized protein LOC111634348 [Centruroides sculpturatus]|uniref:uncharacterized protein LOC111634348 n=1 Tax=Centruroides sculpturatus TaxID=218467 RepID=UPI000C6EC241|nr:uncharacterized protein LOC111634348 [Centruroides sculpturatus]